ncbi:hypothetical protein [Yersinia ruckeri]|uniref:hypothetical protein n=1 Tax=Yersinia ruckeri TaxID=29486 RepID=UPI002238E41D|nr:hypothetical protein [Yersinia ruckeri]MCW6598673.1 hypothetical protein [Yersinia ruckeri]
MGKKKSSNYPIKMRVPLFNCATILFFNNPTEAIAHVEKISGQKFKLDGHDGFEWKYETKDNVFIFLAVFDKSAATLAHEAAHAAFEICDIVQTKVSEDRDNETFCYLLQRIMEKFLPHL